MWTEKVLFVGLYLINLWILVKSQCDVNLWQKYGIVQGFGLIQTTPKGYPFCSFLGIPYAQPPVGDLRFEFPQPIDLSLIGSSFDFRTKSPICVQNQVFTNNTGQEDCLYLNVYMKSQSDEYLKPVIVWIHGGYGHYGSAYTEGADSVGYLVDEDVVVVTFNYRLGILGFLYRKNDNFLGNIALRDQLLALQWVQQNIASFGGNPHKVTIMGWSAGSTDIGYFVQAPIFRGLFHRAIMISGSPFSPWSYERSSDACVNVMCKALNVPCSRGSLKGILKTLPASDFGSYYVNYQTSISYLGEFHPCFVPTYEWNDVKPEYTIVQDQQLRLYHRPIVNDVPLMISHTVAEDWNYYVIDASTFSKPWNYSFVNTRDTVIKQLRRYLIAGINPDERSAKLMVPATMVQGIKEFANYYANTAYSNIYYYRFSYQNPPNSVGTTHGDDLPFIFGPLNKTTTYTDNIVRMRMVSYITNFAKDGNPTPKLNSIIKTLWQPYENYELRMEISNESNMVRDIKDKSYRDWENILACLDYNVCDKFFQITSQ